MELLRREVAVGKWHARDFVRSRAGHLGVLPLCLLYWLHPSSRRRATAIMAAHRYSMFASSDRLGAWVSKRMAAGKDAILAAAPGITSVPAPDAFDDVAARSIVLKAPVLAGTGEKGVLLITFTDSFNYYHHHIDTARLARYFRVVLEPSWAGYATPEILAWASVPSSVIVQASEQRDESFLARLGTNLVPIRMGASDWVDYRTFHPLPGVEKEFDALLIANYNPVKRHHLYFRALRHIADPSFRAALVMARWGGPREPLQALIEHYKLRDRLTVFEQVSQSELNAILNRSKVNLMLSRKEGSNRALFEGFFADVPGILIADNVGVNRGHITPQTGRVCGADKLAEALLHFRDHWRDYSPRAWAMAHIAPEVTAKRLGALLRGLALAAGEQWTTDLVPKVNSPEVSYLSDETRAGLPAAREVLALFRKERRLTDAVLETELCRLCAGASRPARPPAGRKRKGKPGFRAGRPGA